MKTSHFRFVITGIDCLAPDMIYVAGHLQTGVIQPECPALVEGTALQLTIKSVVLVHPANAAAKDVTVMVESLPASEKDMIGKVLISRE